MNDAYEQNKNIPFGFLSIRNSLLQYETLLLIFTGIKRKEIVCTLKMFLLSAGYIPSCGQKDNTRGNTIKMSLDFPSQIPIKYGA